jgi:hypothetical protein
LPHLIDQTHDRRQTHHDRQRPMKQTQLDPTTL